MDVFTINFHHGGEFIHNGATWSYVGGSIGNLDVSSLDTFLFFELEKIVKYIYAGIRRIAYLKPRTGFSQGITFFNEDNGYWEMLKWVREDRIECIKDKRNANINEVVESEDESESA